MIRLSGVNLMMLWHMHQPQYRDPSTGGYLLPWTRLHALKDYWGMVRVLQEFPGVHATFNFVPLLVAQIEEYAGGKFKDPWFDICFAPAESLDMEQRRTTLERAFQVNDNYIRRWPRYAELKSQLQSAGPEGCAAHFGLSDWRDLQVLSQLAWMDEEYIAHDPVVNALSAQGGNFTENDKQALRDKQLELLAAALPEYRLAQLRGQIEISTTPFYHPILPLLCDSDIARVSNPQTPLPDPPFRYPEDAREQLVRAREFHAASFGKPPAGLWPSEGSVSDQVLEMAIDLGFRWFATDEGVLGRTRNVGFWRDPHGYPENGFELYVPWSFRRGEREITGFFRDHYVSDLVGFVYSRMGAEAAADDLYRRVRAIGDRAPAGHTPTVSLILDGENAWEFYPENGRAFLRAFYRRIENDSSIRALTATEALEAKPNKPIMHGIFPASWINANFDVWIGHSEDVRAWDMLRDAREAFSHAKARGLPASQLARAYEAVLAAEGSDWTWWFGPEHGSSNDAEFDALFRKHLTEIYAAIGEHAPESLLRPIKRVAERGRREPPEAYVKVTVDGRETSYFEWMGAGLYFADRGSGAMHGRICAFDEISYGFDSSHLYLRVDPRSEVVAAMRDFQLRLTIWDSRETRVTLQIRNGTLGQSVLEQAGVCLLHPERLLQAAYGKILELSLARDLFDLHARRELLVSVALWQGGLPLDVLPAEGMLGITLGEENFAWPAS